MTNTAMPKIREKQRNHHSSIRRKLINIICVLFIIVILIGSGLVYFLGSNFTRSIIGNQYVQLARVLRTYLDESFDSEVEDTLSYAARRLWMDAITEASSKYSGMNEEEVAAYMQEMNKKWTVAGESGPLVKEYLESRASLSMLDILKVRKNVAEIFITDKYGGLVAASGKTSDFYQGDEEWWKGAYNNGKGAVYVGDIEFDDSSKAWVAPIAVPVKDESGSVIGVCKNCVDIHRLFSHIEDFRIGKTTKAFLTDDRGTAIIRHNSSYETVQLFTEENIRAFLMMDARYMTVNNPKFRKGPSLVAFSRVRCPYLAARNIIWLLFIVQDEAETLEPLNLFVSQLAFISIFLLLMVLPLSSIFASFIARPINELRRATERILEGSWDYKIAVKTGDEIEDFANTFQRMTHELKTRQEKLEELSRTLEARVEDRTKELSHSQQAALNILEDLQAAKENLERTNKELMNLDRLKSEFVSTVSHELRTPLSIVKEGISLILDKIPGGINEKQEKILAISRHNIDRLARIIDSLLDISKIDAGKVELKRNLVDITDIVKQVVVSFEMKIKEKGLDLKLDVDRIHDKVYVDPDRIAQVLTNLLGNAVKFTSKGYIEVSCKEKKDTVVCSVADTGMGIAKDNIAKLFDKFQQFGRLAGPGEKGTGLGLSIAKSIIDLHNGSISAESEEGKGTKFTLVLHKYTEESLFTEHVQAAINHARLENSGFSVAAISVEPVSGEHNAAWDRKFNDLMADNARRVKNTLRENADDIVTAGRRMMIILSDCNKKNADKVLERFKEIIGNNIKGHKLADEVRASYSGATYPDDAKDAVSLLEKTKGFLVLS